MPNAFVSWSGGKDCCLSAYRARQEGYTLKYLVNMINPESERSCSHGIASKWITKQAQAMDIPLKQQTTDGQNYQAQFIAALKGLRAEGVTHGVFGDIDFDPHREWNQTVCDAAGITLLLPLWGLEHKQIALDFIRQGFKAVIVATRSDLLGQEWVGRLLDSRFLADLAQHNSAISACGEAGEFHTLVIDGPLFKKKLVLRDSGAVKRQDHWFLNIDSVELAEK